VTAESNAVLATLQKGKLMEALNNYFLAHLIPGAVLFFLFLFFYVASNNLKSAINNDYSFYSNKLDISCQQFKYYYSQTLTYLDYMRIVYGIDVERNYKDWKSVPVYINGRWEVWRINKDAPNYDFENNNNYGVKGRIITNEKNEQWRVDPVNQGIFKTLGTILQTSKRNRQFWERVLRDNPAIRYITEIRKRNERGHFPAHYSKKVDYSALDFPKYIGIAVLLIVLYVRIF
jgi:hypothetical protein